MKSKFFVIFVLMLCGHQLIGQVKYAAGSFAQPMDGMLLSANFAEVRPNHFHSGIDIKTDGVEGKVVRAIADGYICRVVVSPGGYGRALYVAHPNGTTSVYAHFQRFNKNVEKFAADSRYKLNNHTLDMPVNPGVFPVKKGEQIGLSGNSGMSFGPHLHFEIRESATQRTLNMLAKGVYKVADTIDPTIFRLFYIDTDTVRGVPMHSAPRPMAVKVKADGNYSLADSSVQKIGRSGYFVIEVIDKKNNTDNTMGVYRVTQKVDGNVNYEFRLDSFLFSDTRYVNALSYYPLIRTTRNEMIRLAVLQYNRLPLYTTLKNRGCITLTDDKIHKVQIEVEDDNKNVVTLAFDVKRDDAERVFYTESDTQGLIIDPKRPFIGGTGGVTLTIPAGALYEPLFFKQAMDSATNNGNKDKVKVLSDYFTVLAREIPIHSSATVAIRKDIPAQMRSKVCIASVSDGDNLNYVGGGWRGAEVASRIRNFGKFCIVADTIPPVISSTFTNGANLTGVSHITFVIDDNFSGVDTYSAWIDGKWILFERDIIRKRITHFFDDSRTLPGKKHTLKLEVRDGCGNVSTFNCLFTR